MKIRIKAGDVFSIPVSSDKIGFGQIVNIPDKSIFIIVVFKKIFDKNQVPTIESICSGTILFEGYTLDALLYHKQWIIVGNYTSNIGKIKLPYYKLGTPPDRKIVNYKGDLLRKATKQEFEELEYQTVSSPIQYEMALKAYHKMGDWEDYFEAFYYKNVLTSIKIVEKMGSSEN